MPMVRVSNGGTPVCTRAWTNIGVGSISVTNIPSGAYILSACPSGLACTVTNATRVYTGIMDISAITDWKFALWKMNATTSVLSCDAYAVFMEMK